MLGSKRVWMPKQNGSSTSMKWPMGTLYRWTIRVRDANIPGHSRAVFMPYVGGFTLTSSTAHNLAKTCSFKMER